MFPVFFLTPAIKTYPRKIKLKAKVIRGTKDRPPTVPEKGCYTGSSLRASLTLVAKWWIAGLG